MKEKESGKGPWKGSKGKGRSKPMARWSKDRGGGPRDRTPAARDSDPGGPIRLFGLHAVEAALRNPSRQIIRLLATENAARKLGDAVAARHIQPEPASPRDLDNMLGADTVHQGALLEVHPLAEPALEDLTERALAGAPLVVLDHVTDPHNVGAVLRSAAVFGAAGVVMTRRHSPPLNGVLAKSASGALDVVPVLLVQNLARTLLDLKSADFLILGLDGDAPALLDDEPFADRLAIVLGAEGKGLRELTLETCDRLLRISATGSLTSLNVSNAAAVALHMAAFRRRKN
jgi:23S rRNA (guanosine2251-2'-O)-methyltransferase